MPTGQEFSTVVRSKDELLDALGRYDKIVVEGDERALQQAIEVSSSYMVVEAALTPKSRRWALIWVIFAVVLFILTLIWIYYATDIYQQLLGKVESTPDPRIVNSDRRPPITFDPNNINAKSPDKFTSLVQILVWPSVITIGIAAIFLISWKAISGGNNVEVSWKVTEKVAGRVVITKVRARRS